MTKGHALKTALSVLAVVLVFLLLLSLATMLLQPKYMTDLVEGSMLSQYYREAGGHDVVFIGDCEVYANFSPMELYREAGITAYVRGTSQQLIWQSYYVLKETFSYETPKIVVFNVNAMRYSEPVSEAYNRLALDKMKWSREKVDMILASMTEEETFLSYVFPILRYHSRFDELTEEDFRYLFRTRDNTWNGHLMNKNVKPLESLPTKRILAEYQFAGICYDYLDKIRLLCEENGAELILIKAPSAYPYWYEEYDAQIRSYAEQYGLSFYNFLNSVEEIGIDYSTDTYDGGLHMNLSGATKLSRYFARILAENHRAEDHRGDPEIAAVYKEKLKQYDAEAKK
ncbi:MAG: SGNH/GDSL hydrolase family protein [Oscillospiraceae bacterium]